MIKRQLRKNLQAARTAKMASERAGQGAIEAMRQGDSATMRALGNKASVLAATGTWHRQNARRVLRLHTIARKVKNAFRRRR